MNGSRPTRLVPSQKAAHHARALFSSGTGATASTCFGQEIHVSPRLGPRHAVVPHGRAAAKRSASPGLQASSPPWARVLRPLASHYGQPKAKHGLRPEIGRAPRLDHPNVGALSEAGAAVPAAPGCQDPLGGPTNAHGSPDAYQALPRPDSYRDLLGQALSPRVQARGSGTEERQARCLLRREPAHV
jgi:hypothetical protein